MKKYLPRHCLICKNRTTESYKALFDDRYGAKGKHNIAVCPNCGYGRTIPGIPRSKIGRFYAQHYPISHFTKDSVIASISLPGPLNKWLLGIDNVAHHATHLGETVLDIGSASGVSLLEIKSLGGKPYGVEPDPSGKTLAKQLGLTVHQGFITDNPFPKLKFDLITASQVIEHEPDPLDFLIAIKRKLKPGGRVILSFPNLNALYRYLFGRRWIHWHIPYHLNHFTSQSFALLAKQTGFKITHLRTITPNQWTLLQLRMLMTFPGEGKPSNIWHAPTGSLSHNQTTNLFTRLQYLLSRLFLILITPLNRLLDLSGRGESFLVELRPK